MHAEANIRDNILIRDVTSKIGKSCNGMFGHTCLVTYFSDAKRWTVRNQKSFCLFLATDPKSVDFAENSTTITKLSEFCMNVGYILFV